MGAEKRVKNDKLLRVKPINLKFSFIQNDTYNYIQYRKTTDVSDNLFVHYQGNVIQCISIKLANALYYIALVMDE